MSASINPDSVANREGQFRARIAPSKPLTERGHKPGVIASERDAAPEFTAQTLPAGTAPADRTFQPNPTDEVPTTNMDYSDSNDPEAERVGAQDTIGGATSADVHGGFGHPGQGMTSNEIRHDGTKKREKQSYGNVGMGGQEGLGDVLDPSDPKFADQRGLDDEDAAKRAGTRGKGDPDYLAAQDREKVSAEEYASELPGRTTARGQQL